MKLKCTKEQLNHIHNFLIPVKAYSTVDPTLQEKVSKLKRRMSSSVVILGRADKFGYFIIALTKGPFDGELRVMWTQRNKGSVPMFVELLERDNPVEVKEIKVNNHKRGQDDFVPRIYLDGKILEDLRIEPGDIIIATFNKSSKLIELVPKKAEEVYDV